jgi:DNA repair protein RecN (Recombination protein N)
MLQSLAIQNYALIDDLNINFEQGFSTITGETGAGKSILLGALSLLVGQRADTSVLLDKSRKCVVEGVFKIGEYKLQDFFAENELDYDDHLIIRREILDNGRSRAFVNDSPVNLNVVKELGDRLIDIHSQHQNSFLSSSAFQLKVIDVLAQNQERLGVYKNSYSKYNELQKELSELQEKSAKEKADLDYFQFQYDELEKAKLKTGEQAELEEELKVLSHAEEIKTSLTNTVSLFSDDMNGIVNRLKEAVSITSKLKNIFIKADSIKERIDASYIEIKDIAAEAELLANSIDLDPERLSEVNSRLDALYSLCQKHRVADANALIELKESYAEKILAITGYDDQLDKLSKQLEIEKKKLVSQTKELTDARKSAIPAFTENITSIIKVLGMPYAVFSVNIETSENFTSNGCDQVSFVFTANKQAELMEIARIASGGEISRLMLAVKSVLASALAMPAVIFDEIDTGVSGEIADKMANIMKSMSEEMQVISITHLPQVAAKGINHFLVYKVDNHNSTKTHIKLLKKDERILEIAKMLSGAEISDAAMKNAKVLLEN